MAYLTQKRGRFYVVEKVKTFDDLKGVPVWKNVWTDIHATDRREAETKSRKAEKERPKSKSVQRDVRLSSLMVQVRQRQEKDLKSYFKAQTYLLSRLEQRFGQNFISNITWATLDDWDTAMREEGLSDSSISKYMKGLRAVINLAIKWGKYSGSNPFDSFEIVSEDKPRGVILDEDQQITFLDACYNPTLPLRPRQKHKAALPPQLLRDIVELTLAYGPRLGEIIGVNVFTGEIRNKRKTYIKEAGIRVKDFDPVTNILVLQRTKLKKRESGKAVKKTIIQVIPRIATMFKKYMFGKTPDSLIFSHSDGTPIFAIQKAFDDAVITAKLTLTDEVGTPVTKLQFRDLRPTASSNLLSWGLEPIEVSRLLGHSSLEMVEQVYLRRIQASQMAKASKKIEEGLNVREARAQYGESSRWFMPTLGKLGLPTSA